LKIRLTHRSPVPSDSEYEIVLISNGLSPVPTRLVNRVKQGFIVEMAEFKTLKT